MALGGIIALDQPDWRKRRNRTKDSARWTVERQFKVIIGGNTYINVPNLVVYRGRTLFTLKRHDENGELGIYFELYSATGTHLASVKQNQVYVTKGQKELYTLEGSSNRFVLREKATGQVVCQIRRRPAAMPAELEVSVRLYTPDGFPFDATPTSTNLGGIVLTGGVIENCLTGIAIGPEDVPIG